MTTSRSLDAHHRDLDVAGTATADNDRRSPEVCAVMLHERPEDGDLYE